MSPRTYAVAFTGILVVLAGCSEPNGPVLQGRWGSEQMEVVADSRSAEIRPLCGVARLREPLILNSAGEVDVRAVVDAVSSFQRIRFQATLDGDRLAVRLTSLNADGSSTVSNYELLRGLVPSYAGVICLAG